MISSLRTVEFYRTKAGHWRRILEGESEPFLLARLRAAHGFETGYEPRARFLSPAELASLLGELTADHAARVVFIVATSASWGETERARREHVADDLSVVFLDGTKRKQRRRSVPIVTEQQNTLLAYAMKYAGGKDALFEPWITFAGISIAPASARRSRPALPTTSGAPAPPGSARKAHLPSSSLH